MATFTWVLKNLMYPGVGVRILAVFQKVTKFISDLLHVIWANRVIILGLLLLYLILWKANQGQDLLVNLNSKFKTANQGDLSAKWIYFIGTNLGPALFYLLLTVLALLNWFLPKYFANTNRQKLTWHYIFVENWNYERSERTLKRNSSEIRMHYVFISRLLGVLTFVIPACAILSALDEFKIIYPFKEPDRSAHSILGSIFIVYVLLLYPFFDSRKSGTFCRNLIPQVGNNVLEEAFEWFNRKNATWVILAIFILLIGTILGLGLRNSGHPRDLFWLSVGLLIMSFVFALFVSIRRRLGCKRTGRLAKFWYQMRQYNLNTFILSLGLAFSVIFILLNFAPFLFTSSPIARTTTISVVLTGVIFYIMLFTALILAGRKWQINLAGGVLAIMVITAILWDNKFHDVHTVALPTQPNRVSLEKYMAKWLEDRRGDIASYNNYRKKYPIVLVNAHGGGIRAAAWTSMAITYLDSVVAHSDSLITNKNESFQRHVLSYSGASGGTIGASVLTVFSNKFGSSYVVPSRTLLEFYQNDFLTPVVIGLIGRDVLFSTFRIGNEPDRARLQTQLWEKYLDGTAAGMYGQEYSSLWVTPNGKLRTDIPLLFSNTYHLESGQKGIIAPVKLKQDDFVASVLVSEFLAKQNKSLSLSTGAFLSARFPYVSPAGKLDSVHHFLDGGIRENSGAETSREIYAVLERVLREQGYTDRVEVVCLSLDNEGKADPEQASKNVFELTAPAIGIYNVRVGNAAKAEAMNKGLFQAKYHQLTPVVDTIRLDQSGNFKPVLPLGWQISYPALIRLQKSLTCKEMKAMQAPLIARFKHNKGIIPTYTKAPR